MFSLEAENLRFNETDFIKYKEMHAQRLLDSFFDMALLGISMAFLFRIIFLWQIDAMLDLILPFIIFCFVGFLYWVNSRTSQMKHYFHICAIPAVGALTLMKSIKQNSVRFYLNESFASWFVMMIYGSFSSTRQWYTVGFINIICFGLFIAVVFYWYGFKLSAPINNRFEFNCSFDALPMWMFNFCLQKDDQFKGVGNDFYVHMPTVIFFSTCLIRMNELNLRNSF